MNLSKSVERRLDATALAQFEELRKCHHLELKFGEWGFNAYDDLLERYVTCKKCSATIIQCLNSIYNNAETPKHDPENIAMEDLDPRNDR